MFNEKTKFTREKFGRKDTKKKKEVIELQSTSLFINKDKQIGQIK